MKTVYFTIIPMFALIPIIAFKVRKFDYQGWINLCNRIITGLTNSSATFTTPTPAITVLTSALSDLQTAYDTWLNKTTRTHNDLLDLRAKCETAANMLKAEASYVTSVSRIVGGSDESVIESLMLSSGFDLKNSASKQDRLEAVVNFRKALSAKLDDNQSLLRWNKPVNLTSPDNLVDYKVLCAATDSLAAAVQVGQTSTTEFVITNTTDAPVTNYYTIVPVGTAGDGVASGMVKVTTPGL